MTKAVAISRAVEDWTRGFTVSLMGLMVSCLAALPSILIFWMASLSGIQGGLPEIPGILVFAVLFPWWLGSFLRTAGPFL